MNLDKNILIRKRMNIKNIKLVPLAFLLVSNFSLSKPVLAKNDVEKVRERVEEIVKESPPPIHIRPIKVKVKKPW